MDRSIGGGSRYISLDIRTRNMYVVSNNNIKVKDRFMYILSVSNIKLLVQCIIF